MNTPIAAPPARNAVFDRIVQSHYSPQARVPRFSLVDLRSISVTLILSKRYQGWTTALRTRNVAALQSFVRIDDCSGVGEGDHHRPSALD